MCFQVDNVLHIQCDFLDFFSYFVSHSWGKHMMKITGLSHLFKWENLHNWWLTKYFFAPLYIYFFVCKASMQSFGVSRSSSDRDGILFAFIILQKHHRRSTQINVESLQIQKMSYSYLHEQQLWSILRASECTGISICPAVSATVQLPHSTQWTAHISLV